MFSSAKDRLQVSSVFRAGLAGITNRKETGTMAAQPFHRMAPVPPHLSYKPEISTYMDHFRKPRPPIRRRQVIPPQMLMPPRQPSANYSSQKMNGTTKPLKPPVKTTVKDYMDDLMKMSDRAFPPYNARTDVPFKSAQPNQRQREDLRKIARSGYGITSTEARDIVRNDRSVDFYNQHKLAANNPTARVKSAPAPKMPQAKDSTQSHWIAWNSGTPEPPGLQKRLHKPWPSPEPPKTANPHSCLNASVPRPVTGTLLPTNPNNPVPDMIGSEGINPTLTTDREQAFSPKPDAIPLGIPTNLKMSHSSSRHIATPANHSPLQISKQVDIKFAPNFRQLIVGKEDGVPDARVFVEPEDVCSLQRVDHRLDSSVVNTMNVGCQPDKHSCLRNRIEFESAKVEKENGCRQANNNAKIPARKTPCYNKPFCLGSRHPCENLMAPYDDSAKLTKRKPAGKQ